jgi:hypothetical protein
MNDRELLVNRSKTESRSLGSFGSFGARVQYRRNYRHGGEVDGLLHDRRISPCPPHCVLFVAVSGVSCERGVSINSIFDQAAACIADRKCRVGCVAASPRGSRGL